MFSFKIQEKQTVEEEEENDSFDMDIKITDPEKVGRYQLHKVFS